MPSPRIVLPIVCVFLLGACSSDSTGADSTDASSIDVAEDATLDGGSPDATEDAAPALVPIDPVDGLVARFDPGGELYDAPWPSEHLRNADGGVELGRFPNPDDIPFVDILLDIIDRDARGFGTTSGVFFAWDASLDGVALPDVLESVETGSSIVLLNVDEESAELGRRHPFEASFTEDAGPFGTTHLLSLVPQPGIPLQPGTRYAAIVMRSLDARLGRDATTTALLNGQSPSGISSAAAAEYALAAQAIVEQDIDREEIAAWTVFRTDDPQRDFRSAVAGALDAGVPELDDAPVLTETYDNFCVFESRVTMPVFQEGEPPFTSGGGGWGPDADALVVQAQEQARVFFTVPRAPMPEAGYPVVLFVRTGGGGDRPLIDRGLRSVAGQDPENPGTGPAQEFARVGWAGAMVDGPHGGIRNVTRGDEQFIIFNVSNPWAMRDNIRQSALELVLFAEHLAELEFDASACNGVDEVGARFDADHIVLMGHSMGATIAPLAAAGSERFEALLLSGAGGSWIDNVVYKDNPLPVRPLAEALLGYTAQRRALTRHDPVLSLLQWAGEAADPPVYGTSIVSDTSPMHVLMMQGIVDTYLYPPIANATSLSMRLDLLGEAFDEQDERLIDFMPLRPLLPLVGAEQIDGSAMGNRAEGLWTHVVTQHVEDGLEDGHEVVFQTEPPKEQYRCFLASLLDGVPEVISAAATCTLD